MVWHNHKIIHLHSWKMLTDLLYLPFYNIPKCIQLTRFSK